MYYTWLLQYICLTYKDIENEYTKAELIIKM